MPFLLLYTTNRTYFYTKYITIIMTDIKSTLPHIALIAKSEIKKKDFDTNLQNLLDAFERRFAQWKNQKLKRYEAGDPIAVKSYDVMVSESTIIAQHIYDYFVEEEDQIDNSGTDKLDASTVNKMADQIKDNKDTPPENNTPPPPPIPDPETIIVDTPPAKVPEVKLDDVKDPEPPKVDTKVADDPEPEDSDEKVLHKFFKEGKLSGISKAMLHKEGFDTGFFGNLTSKGQTCGKYRLYKESNEEFYNLKKI